MADGKYKEAIVACKVEDYEEWITKESHKKVRQSISEQMIFES